MAGQRPGRPPWRQAKAWFSAGEARPADRASIVLAIRARMAGAECARTICMCSDDRRKCALIAVQRSAR